MRELNNENHLDILPKEILALILRFVGMKEGIKLSWVAQKYRQLYWDWIIREFEAIESFDDSQKHQEIENTLLLRSFVHNDLKLFETMLSKRFSAMFDALVLQILEAKSKGEPNDVLGLIKKILDTKKNLQNNKALELTDDLKNLFKMTKNTKLSGGKTFLMIAILHDRFDIFSYILSCDPDLGLKIQDNVSTLQYILLHKKDNYFDVTLEKFSKESKQSKLLKICVLLFVEYKNRFMVYGDFPEDSIVNAKVIKIIDKCSKAIGLSEDKDNDYRLCKNAIEQANTQLFDILLKYKLDLNYISEYCGKKMTILDIIKTHYNQWLKICEFASDISLGRINAINKLDIYRDMENNLKKAGAKTSKELGI